MKSTIGRNISFTLFGESHQSAIGCVVDGLCSGVKIDENFIAKQMNLRKAQGKISTTRIEADKVQFISGVYNGYTTGAPICIMIENTNTKSDHYQNDVLRPSHADFVAINKYGGYGDYRGSGHFSGRLTAPLVAYGAICIKLLQQKDIYIGTHICQIKQLKDQLFSDDITILKQEILKVNDLYFATINDEIANQMITLIEQAKDEQDSIACKLESCVINLPISIGEPFFNSLESILSHYLFSIPAIKGVEFGLGFDFIDYNGSQVNDQYQIIDEKIATKSNNNGGINGGISNGNPIKLKVIIKPTPSISKKQDSVNITNMCNETLEILGRHDPCIGHRARVVVDSVIAMALVDLLQEKYGYNYFQGA